MFENILNAFRIFFYSKSGRHIIDNNNSYYNYNSTPYILETTENPEDTCDATACQQLCARHTICAEDGNMCGRCKGKCILRPNMKPFCDCSNDHGVYCGYGIMEGSKVLQSKFQVDLPDPYIG